MLRRKKTFKGTWLDRAGESTELLATSSPIGPRIVVHCWLDTNEVIIRAIDGDAFRHRRPFKEWSEIKLQSPTPEAVAAAVAFSETVLNNRGHNLIPESHSTHFA